MMAYDEERKDITFLERELAITSENWRARILTTQDSHNLKKRVPSNRYPCQTALRTHKMFGRGVKLCDSVVTTCALSMLRKLSKLTACHTRFCNIQQGMLTDT